MGVLETLIESDIPPISDIKRAKLMAAQFIEKLKEKQIGSLWSFEMVIDELADANDERGVRDVCNALAQLLLLSSRYRRKKIIEQIQRQSLFCKFLLSQSLRMIGGTVFPIYQVLMNNFPQKEKYMTPPTYLRVFGPNTHCNLGVKVGKVREIYEPTSLKLPNVIKIVMSNYHTLFLTIDGEVFACGRKSNISIYKENPEDVYVEPVLINFPSSSTSKQDPILDIEASDNCSLLLSTQHIYLIGQVEFQTYLTATKVSENCRRFTYNLHDVQTFQTRVFNTKHKQFEIRTLLHIEMNCLYFRFDNERLKDVEMSLQFFRLLVAVNGLPLQLFDVQYFHFNIPLFGAIIPMMCQLEKNRIMFQNWTMACSRPIIMCLNGRRINWMVEQYLVSDDGSITVRFSDGFVARGKLEFWRRRNDYSDFELSKKHANNEIAKKLKRVDLVAVLEECFGTFGATMLVCSPDVRNIIIQCGMDEAEVHSTHRFCPDQLDSIRTNRIDHCNLPEELVPINLLLRIEQDKKNIFTNKGIFELSYPYAIRHINEWELDFDKITDCDKQVLEEYISGDNTTSYWVTDGIDNDTLDTGLTPVPFVYRSGEVNCRLKADVVRTSFVPEGCLPGEIIIIKTSDNENVPVFAPLMYLHATQFMQDPSSVSFDIVLESPTYPAPFSKECIELALNCLLDMDLMVWMSMEKIIQVYLVFEFYKMREALTTTRILMMSTVSDDNIHLIYPLAERDKQIFDYFESRPYHVIFSNSPIAPSVKFSRMFCQLFENDDYEDSEDDNVMECEEMEEDEESGDEKMEEGEEGTPPAEVKTKVPKTFLENYDADDCIRNFLTFENDEEYILKSFAKECNYPIQLLVITVKNYLKTKDTKSDCSVRKFENLLLLSKGVKPRVAEACDSIYGQSWRFREFLKRKGLQIDSDFDFPRIVQSFENYTYRKTLIGVDRRISLVQRENLSEVCPSLVILDSQSPSLDQVNLANLTVMAFWSGETNQPESCSSHILKLDPMTQIAFSLQYYDKSCRESSEGNIQTFRRIGLPFTKTLSLEELRYFISTFQSVQLDVKFLSRMLRLRLVDCCKNVYVCSEEDADGLSLLWRRKYENFKKPFGF